MTECSRCGDCCTDIFLTTSKARGQRDVLRHGDPRDDAVWASWVAGWAAEDPPFIPKHRENWIRTYLDASFIAEHWHGGRRARGYATKGWTCDRFDPEARLCTAYADRPPICEGFPYYGREPSECEPGKDGGRLPLRCSFWADFPEEQRPEGWAPVAFTGSRAPLADAR